MWLIWKWIGLGVMIFAYFLLVYWQRRHWRSLSTELGIVAITMMFFDQLMTWLGQSHFYWQKIGKPVVDEINPFGCFFLGLHPISFVAACIFYMIIVIALIRFFSRWSKFLMIFISAIMIVAHGYCAFDWFFKPPISTKIGWWINDIPFMYLPFIILALIMGILLMRKKRNRL